MEHRIAETVAIAIMILVNVVWYQAKFFIRSQGLPAPWFWRHYSNFGSLQRSKVGIVTPEPRCWESLGTDEELGLVPDDVD